MYICCTICVLLCEFNELSCTQKVVEWREVIRLNEDINKDGILGTTLEYQRVFG